jgi:raffinose/stachyose/melibiose transport system substrate-binding protein
MKRVTSIALSFLLICAGLAFANGSKESSSSTQSTSSNKPVQITILNTKGEIAAQLKTLSAAFSKENPGITLSVDSVPTGTSPFQALTTRYASGNAPTLDMLDPSDLPKFADKFLDLSGQEWVAQAASGTLSLGTINGKLVGFPFTVEGYGLIYNKAVLDKAYGGSFDPSSIKTRDDLKAAFEKVKASGVAPIIVTPMDWSLGNHFLGIGYGDQSSDPAKVVQFLSDLKAGKVDLSKNAVMNGLLDTLDLMGQYNKGKDDPMAVTYDDGPKILGSGQAGFWFMGTWAMPQIAGFDKTGTYGFIPVPISNNASDYGNAQIPAGPTKFIGLDKSQSTPEQQAAAEKFLNWVVNSSTAQKILIDQAKIVMAFKNVKLKPTDPLGKSMVAYMSAGKTSDFAANRVPADHWKILGADMQKYFVGKMSRADLFKAIKSYWTNHQQD